MQKNPIFLDYFDKQIMLLNRLYREIIEKELELIQEKLRNEYLKVESDLKSFRAYIKTLEDQTL